MPSLDMGSAGAKTFSAGAPSAPLRINADFSQAVVITPDQHTWMPSPQAGVERVMLDRVGSEKARATSLVRYAPDSNFPPHAHPGGEEILVLSGTFSEAGRHATAGCYLRNPPGSSHQPSSGEGALLFVKLWQMAPDDSLFVHTDTSDPSAWRPGVGPEAGHEVCPLFTSASEQVRLLRARPLARVLPASVDGAELLVLEGGLMVGERACGLHSWVRLPPGEYPQVVAAESGATIYLKTGHLARVAQEADAWKN